MKLETVEKIVELLNEKKKAYKALADDYKDRYNNNKDSNKAICRNMYYQNIYRYNEAEDTLAEIEGRQPKMYCFTLPPFIDLPKILAEYEKIQWHDLRKDPDDLPKEDKDYLIFTEEFGVEIRNYFSDTKGFSCRPTKMVIAWKEIGPFKFEEEDINGK